MAVRGREAPPRLRTRPAQPADAVTTPEENRAGKGASTPTDIPSAGWWAILKRTFAEVGNDRVLAVAGGVTFYGLLSLFPATIVLVGVELNAEIENRSRRGPKPGETGSRKA